MTLPRTEGIHLKHHPYLLSRTGTVQIDKTNTLKTQKRAFIFTSTWRMYVLIQTLGHYLLSRRKTLETDRRKRLESLRHEG